MDAHPGRGRDHPDCRVSPGFRGNDTNCCGASAGASRCPKTRARAHRIMRNQPASPHTRLRTRLGVGRIEWTRFNCHGNSHAPSSAWSQRTKGGPRIKSGVTRSGRTSLHRHARPDPASTCLLRAFPSPSCPSREISLFLSPFLRAFAPSRETTSIPDQSLPSNVG